jgi:hypothetical protein
MPLNKYRKDNIWDEYKYRHEHVWKLIFQLTAAVVALAIVPYLDTSGSSGVLRFIPPGLSILLIWIAYIRIGKEFDLLDQVKEEYLGTRTGTSTFRLHVRLYVFVLGAGSTLHFILLVSSQLSGCIRSFLGISIQHCT